MCCCVMYWCIVSVLAVCDWGWCVVCCVWYVVGVMCIGMRYVLCHCDV